MSNVLVECGRGGRVVNGDAPVAPSFDMSAISGRFPPRIRREVARLYLSSPRLADLAQVFPGLLAALASRRGSLGQRSRAMQLIESGAQLRTAARALNMPMWLRRLPAEAFVNLPVELPQSEKFGRRIIARLPRASDDTAHWLASVLFAERAVSEDFAIWLAAQPVFSDSADCTTTFGVLAAYAWFSAHPGTEGHKYIVVPWRPEISFETAMCAAKSWFNRIRLVLQLPAGTLVDPWLQPSDARGFTISALLDHGEIFAEAQAMQNCADQFAERLAFGSCRLFSIRRNGQRVATLEIAQHEREAGILAIRQLKARHNMPASSEVWQAAHAWLSEQTDLRRVPPLTATKSVDSKMDQDAWGRIMAAYRDDRGGAAWMPTVATYQAFCLLDHNMTELARRGNVSSWLFN